MSDVTHVYKYFRLQILRACPLGSRPQQHREIQAPQLPPFPRTEEGGVQAECVLQR